MEVTTSVSELEKNPIGTVAAGEGLPVAISNCNETAFYCVPAEAYEALMRNWKTWTQRPCRFPLG